MGLVHFEAPQLFLDFEDRPAAANTTALIQHNCFWEVTKEKHQEMERSFDLCIIDSTDDPLGSPWSMEFFQNLKTLLAPHGAVVQNIGSQMDELRDFRKMHVVFQRRYIINCNSPDYPSPYFAALLTEELNLHDVDWAWWSSLNISTIYYHPTLHGALLSVPQETVELYIESRRMSCNRFCVSSVPSQHPICSILTALQEPELAGFQKNVLPYLPAVAGTLLPTPKTATASVYHHAHHYGSSFVIIFFLPMMTTTMFVNSFGRGTAKLLL